MHFDGNAYIIVDTPPYCNLSEASQVVSRADVLLLVYSITSVQSFEIAEAILEQLPKKRGESGLGARMITILSIKRSTCCAHWSQRDQEELRKATPKAVKRLLRSRPCANFLETSVTKDTNAQQEIIEAVLKCLQPDPKRSAPPCAVMWGRHTATCNCSHICNRSRR